MKSIFKKTILPALLFLFVGVNVYAQDYSKVDETVKDYKINDINKLAAQINKDFSREDEKARAIFTWLATNIKYDLAALNSNKGPEKYSYRTEAEKKAIQEKIKNDLAIKTFKSKKGVCEGYATLFIVLAEKTGLEAEFIPGTAKSHPNHIGKLPVVADHAWNAVKTGNEWKLVDATWGAGTVTGAKPQFNFRYNDGYFFADPEVFFLNHFPEDEKWLLTKKSKQEFADLPLYYGNYLSGGYKFLSPNEGSFSKSKATVLPFKIKNLKPTDEIAYAFSGNSTFQQVKPVKNGDLTEFDITLDSKAKGYLTIFINQKSVASYKIN